MDPAESTTRTTWREDRARRAAQAVVAIVAMVTASSTVLAADEPTVAAASVVCTSKAGERNDCSADTRAGVAIVKSLGTVTCEAGTTWGFDAASIWVRNGCSAEFSVGAQVQTPPAPIAHTPGSGFKIVDTPSGALNVRLWTYVRYLNQKGLDEQYTDAFGKTSDVKQRQDMQLNKVNIFFMGWLMDPKFRYMAYVWTQNTAQGSGAQVVVGGFLSYAFNKHATVSAGITSLPGVRSTEGTHPSWLGVDDRLIADAFFQPSFTTGIFSAGEIVRGLKYNAMLGNNLSQLGVDAGQLGNTFNTFSGEIVWMPTTGEFGRASGFGDFDAHRSVATRFAAHYTRSDEDRQSQPNTEAIENSQIRISDGNVVFTPGLFGPGISVSDVMFRMSSADAGFKYRGFAVEGEYYWRWLDNFRGVGTEALPFTSRFDHGFQLQTSAMVRPQTLQVYLSGAKIFGQYGDPSEWRTGVNVYPWKNQVVRWNIELIHLKRSPVGSLSLPYAVGGNGPVFHTNVEVNF
jgi:hypothetical protein